MVNLSFFVFVGSMLPLVMMKGNKTLNTKSNIKFTKWDRFVGFLNDGFLDANMSIRIDMGLSSSINDAEKYSTRLDFKDNIARVTVLSEALKKYLMNPNNITKTLFTEACGNYSMRDVTSNILREITRENHVKSLIVDLEKINDLYEFMVWSKLISLTFIQASILGNACLGAVHASEPNLNEARLSLRNSAREGFSQLIDILRKMEKSLISNTDWTFEVFQDVQDLLNKNNNQSKDELFFGVYKHLLIKYSWRSWLIVSYDRNIAPGQHYADIVSDNIFSVPEPNYGGSLFITSIEREDAKESVENLDKCGSAYWVKPRLCGEFCSCQKFLEQYRVCIKKNYPGLSYKAVFCVKYGNHVYGGDGMGLRIYDFNLYKTKNGFTVYDKTSFTVNWHTRLNIILYF